MESTKCFVHQFYTKTNVYLKYWSYIILMSWYWRMRIMPYLPQFLQIVLVLINSMAHIAILYTVLLDSEVYNIRRNIKTLCKCCKWILTFLISVLNVHVCMCFYRINVSNATEFSDPNTKVYTATNGIEKYLFLRIYQWQHWKVKPNLRITISKYFNGCLCLRRIVISIRILVKKIYIFFF